MTSTNDYNSRKRFAFDIDMEIEAETTSKLKAGTYKRRRQTFSHLCFQTVCAQCGRMLSPKANPLSWHGALLRTLELLGCWKRFWLGKKLYAENKFAPRSDAFISSSKFEGYHHTRTSRHLQSICIQRIYLT
uniref:Uncharacterized protein n=1 Tax=Anopheles maculatus TaxID=74869 RepID=A0A182T9G7_9DIPT